MALRATVRPLAKDLLNASEVTGPTAGLWIAVATQADYYDHLTCSYYDVCHLTGRLTRAPCRSPAPAMRTTPSLDAASRVRGSAGLRAL
ncbi:hypothetical protein ACFPH6_32480 [Streptomyces xiangluensis]|uniref:Uncharacterized protein n=1 Tax=Streptomyces xiangluensis TaxID=2665720 RepID=A0ABV8YX16_9ACTN